MQIWNKKGQYCHFTPGCYKNLENQCCCTSCA